MTRRGAGLRAREIMFAVSVGAVAAGGAALVLATSGIDRPPVAAATVERLTYDVAPFQSISTSGPQDVVIKRGDTQSIRSQGPTAILGQLEVVVEDGVLTIQPKEPFRDGFDWSRFNSATFYVTVPRLESVSVAGSGDVSVDRIEGESFSGSVNGSGELSIAALQVNDADLSVGGSGDLIAAGTARKTRVSIGGSGEVQANALRSETAIVTIGGSGEVELTVDDEASVSITGSGNVDIAGTASCTVSRFGSGNVRCGGNTE